MQISNLMGKKMYDEAYMQIFRINDDLLLLKAINKSGSKYDF
jgi:hypothetical protein